MSTDKKGADAIKHYVRTLPSVPGVYRMLNANGDVLYVGKAKDLKKRVTAYTRADKHPVRIQRMIFETTEMIFITTHTEAEALLLEAELIKKLQPRYNILLRDGKTFPYIHMTKHDYPQLTKHRGARSKKGVYFGPFANVGAVNRTLAILQKVFMLRNCSDSIFASRTRPCLQYQIKRCTAPCVDYVTKDEYASQFQMAKDFLLGKSSKIQAKFAKDMQEASDNMEFERAAMLRDRIRALTGVQSQHTMAGQNIKDADVIALYVDGGSSCVQVFFYRGGHSYGNRAYFPRHDKDDSPAEILSAFIGQFYANKPAPRNLYLNYKLEDRALLIEALEREADHAVKITTPQRGEKKRLVDHALQNAKQALDRKRASTTAQAKHLAKLAEVFDLEDTPKRVEVYDNSHIQGAHAIGAMVVATEDGFAKAHYRIFNIKDPDITNDDFGMMREVFHRRFARALKDDPNRETGIWPDLVLIDGGAGQLSAVRETLESLDIDDVPLVAVAKGPDRNAGREKFYMDGRDVFSLPTNDPTLYFIQRLRDEAHRFAIGSHRNRRSKNTIKSELDDIEGVGPKRKKALLHHFGSLKAIKRAGITELQQVEGVSAATAKNIYDRFHDSV